MKKIIIIISSLLIVALSYNAFMNYKFHEKTKQLNDLIKSFGDVDKIHLNEMTAEEIELGNKEFSRKSAEIVKEAENYKSKWLFRMW